MEYAVDHLEIRDAVAKLCSKFSSNYWQHCDQNNNYPKEFVKALGKAIDLFPHQSSSYSSDWMQRVESKYYLNTGEKL